ncbi:hypothetical protein KL864_31860 [Mycolicibacterium goodii]|uniref:hypothetical protein n=1 Tax=Mycolicibacterium goodii TaxID=134601 RepID=UPI001BDCDAEC|nr:hypothetical protein [Mycolicibacterium goodii]MBU8820473.1 hypothetical protein [Mycolicibacterium goodii]
MTEFDSRWPVLSAEDFQLVDHATERVRPFIDDGSGVFGYGHWNRVSFAAAVNDYELHTGGSGSADEYGPDDVHHLWAVVVDRATLRFSCSGVTADHPHSFPVTLIRRSPPESVRPGQSAIFTGERGRQW